MNSLNQFDETMIDIEWIKKKTQFDDYYFSKHGDAERQNDNLSILEVKEAISNSIILEEYKDTGRGKSCLIVGFTNTGKPVHVICGKSDDTLVIITVYIPTPPKFKNPYERSQ